jgi:tetratricopeptide (TPR) repeat protein
MMKHFISLFFLFCTSLIHAESKVDSLKRIINESNNDSLKIEVLNQLSIHYEFSSDLENAAKYHNQRVLLLQKSPNPKGLGDIYNYIGRQHYYKQVYDSAIFYFEKSAGYFEKANFKKGIISARNNIAAIYGEQGNFKKSIFQHHKLISINSGKSFDKVMLASSYSNLGFCYMEISRNDSAIYYLTKAAKLNKESNALPSLASNYYNLAVINTNAGLYDKALYYLNEIELNNLPVKNNMENLILCLKSTTYRNKEKWDSVAKYIYIAKQKCISSNDNLTLLSVIGNEAAYFTNQKNYSKAEECLMEGLKLSEKIGSESFIGKYYMEIGNLYMGQNKNKAAINYFQQAIKIEVLNNATKNIITNLKHLAKAHSKMGNFEEATLLLDSIVRYSESVNSIVNFKATKELEEQYLSEKKDAQIKLQEKDIEEKKKQNQRQQYALWLGALVIAIMTLLAYLAFKNYQKSKKQNLIIEQQKSVVEEKQKEIIASIKYAKRIQQSLLPTKAYLDKKIKPN